VQIPANSTLPAGSSIKIIECAQAAVSATTDSQALPLCDGLTIQGDTVLAASDGSVNYGNSSTGFTVYALPDNFSLGEPTNGTPKCDLSNPCVLYIGTDQTHPFSSPHLWSQTWTVHPTTGDTGSNPGDGTPELSLAIGLPLLAAGLLGGTFYLRHRRSASSSRA
jgi:hypothetical protein